MRKHVWKTLTSESPRVDAIFRMLAVAMLVVIVGLVLYGSPAERERTRAAQHAAEVASTTACASASYSRALDTYLTSARRRVLHRIGTTGSLSTDHAALAEYDRVLDATRDARALLATICLTTKGDR